MASNLPTSATETAATTSHAPIPLPITAQEAAILRRILGAATFDGAAELLDQVRMLQLLPASDATFRIYVQHPDAPRSSFSRGGRTKIPVSTPVWHPEGRVIGKVDIWVDDGQLRALNYASTTARAAMMLPNPDWVVVPLAAAPRPAPVPAPLEATAPATSVAPTVAPAPGPRGRSLIRSVATVIAALLLVTILATAFALGRARGGTEATTSSTAAVQEARTAGAADGAALGSLRGFTEGELAGRASTYQASFDATQAAALAKVRAAARAKAQQAREAAAAKAAAAAAQAAQAAPRNTNNTTCSGYRDSRGYWICS
ncbi:MAG: hypothetical protein JWM25_404 [Thermoleophilia bacterium]|nr:hypothetical protein [Thermoleophilia bacterium]